MECYFKVKHIFYCIKTGECLSINTERNSINRLASIPSAYIKDVVVISKEEFEKAKLSVISGL